MLDISLIILSAGSSSRFGVKTKKQWLRCGDEPLWNYVAKGLSSYYPFKEVIIAGAHEELRYMYKFSDAKIIKGGATRQSSLINSLQYVTTKYVLVNDAARAGIPKELVDRLIQQADSADVIVPCLGVSDTVVYDDKTINREKIRLIQTPQLSNTEVLKAALSSGGEFTDESSAIASYGGSVKYIQGDVKAEKLTSSFAKNAVLSLLPPPANTTFTGMGFDVHAYEEGKKMYLCGVLIDENLGFKAHSDGDVAIHALIDALLGAAGAGDIGEWFPDTEARYKNADSAKLLEYVVEFLQKTGFEIVNCDLTIILQKPKIASFKQAMTKRLSEILRVPQTRINIKATTTEGLGFTGRNEGAAAAAVAGLKYYDWKSDESINR